MTQHVTATRLAAIMACTAMVGLCVVALTQSIELAVLGLMLMGFGTSALFPMAIASAAKIADRAAAANVASLSQMAFVAGIATPIVLGVLVQAIGIRMAFASGLLVMAVSLAMIATRRPFSK